MWANGCAIRIGGQSAAKGFADRFQVSGCLAHIRVELFFMPDGGGAGVAGDNERVVRQPEKFVADVFQQILMIAAREIGASDAFVEQYVARYQQLGGGAMEHDVPRRVPGDVQHVKREVAHAQRVAFVQPARGREHGANRKAVRRGSFRQRIQQKLVIRMRPDNGNALPFQQHRHAACVVKMPVREPDGVQFQAAFVHFGEQMFGIAAHVYQHCIARFIVPQQRAVLAKRGYGRDVQLQCHGRSLCDGVFARAAAAAGQGAGIAGLGLRGGLRA